MHLSSEIKPIIFLSGATGLVGRYLTLELIKQGYVLHLLVRNKEIAEASLRDWFKMNTIQWKEDQIVLFTGDILDVVAIEDAMKDASIVIHAAAMVSAYPSERWEMMKVNHEGTANIVNLALANNIEYFIHISSVSTIGTTLTKTSDESTFLNTDLNHSPYALSKYLAEKEVYRGMEEGLSAIVLNPSFILGIGDTQKSSFAYISKISKGLNWFIPGSINVVDVRDVVKSVVLALEKRPTNTRYILSSAQFTNKAFLEFIQKSLNISNKQREVPNFVLIILPFIANVISLIFRTKPFITKEMIQMAKSDNPVNSNKLINTLEFKFYTLDETAEFLKHEMNKLEST